MIRLNCDIGEGFGIYKLNDDKQIYPHIDMANLACGFHASDASQMYQSVHEARKNNTTIGAHVAYQDLVGFGRRSMDYTKKQLSAIVLYQIGALSGFCKVFHTKVSYVKPHGAMYNDMMKNKNIFETIIQTISSYDDSLKLMILSTPENKIYEKIASKFNIKLIYEVFADRNYTDAGLLVSRTKVNAVIHDKTLILKRVQTLIQDGYLLSESGQKLYLQTDSLCVHGDTTHAIDIVKSIKKLLRTKI
jgi:UPF0271 protein